MRTTIVSTSKLRINKILGITVFSAFFCGVVILAIIQASNGQIFTGLTLSIVWIVICYKAIRMILKLKDISYDDSSVYYKMTEYEVQVPFEEIKDIKIKTLTGVYVIDLYHPNQDYKEIHFKMSFWYPFNFRKQDEKVNDLRDRIDRYKRTLPEKNFRGLSSYKI